MRLKKLLFIATLIFSTAYTGCGDDGGGGGGGNSAKPGNPGNPGTPPEAPQVQRLATRSLGQISVGGGQSCAVTPTGKVLCWGRGVAGQLGNGTDANLNRPDSSKPVVDENGNALVGIVQVSIGGGHLCALSEEGRVYCWGGAVHGQLGNNCDSSCTNKNHAVAVVAKDGSTDPLTGIIQVSAGEDYTCALTDAGEVLCWGRNVHGQLGYGSGGLTDHPVSVVTSGDDNAPHLSGIIQISAGGAHACALTVEGAVTCWGNGVYGQLGNKKIANSNYAVDVVTSNSDTAPLTGIVQINAGYLHTCAVTSAGGVKCWGISNGLGDGGNANKSYPVDVVASGDDNAPPLASITDIAIGDAFSCALDSSSSIKCWGTGTFGQLGNDSTNSTNYPVDVIAESGSPFALSGIVQISSRGAAHICALTSSGEIVCWGNGGQGRLGNNATDNHSAPVPVVSDTNGTPFHVGLWRRQYHCYDDDTCEIDPDSLIRPVLTGAREGTSATPEVEVLGLEVGESCHPPPRRQMRSPRASARARWRRERRA